MDKIIDLIGTTGAIILSISFIPQTLKIYKNSEYGNICFCILMILCSLMMTIYSYYYFVIPMFIANISVLFNNIFIFIIIKTKIKNNKIDEFEKTIDNI